MSRMILSRSSSEQFSRSPEAMADLLAIAQEHANEVVQVVDVIDDTGELLAIVTPEEIVDNPCEKVIVRRSSTRSGSPYLQRAAVCESTYRDYGFERGYKFLRYHDAHPKRAQELERQRQARQRDEARRAKRTEAAERQERQRETEARHVGGRSDFEERREARRERLEARSEKTRSGAEAAYKRSKDIASRIPLGEPIKRGHHSERRHRGDVAKIESYGRKAFQAFDEADELADKAAAVGSGGISQDDPAAIRKLRDELADAEEYHAKAKQLAAAWRKAWLASSGPHQDRIVATMRHPAVTAIGMPADILGGVARTVELQPFRAERPLDLAGMTARIRRIKQRIEELGKQRATAPSSDAEYPEIGVIVRDMVEDNRIGLVFEQKTDDETRRLLKTNGFRWAPSVGAWVRYRNDAGRYAVARVIEQLENIPR